MIRNFANKASACIAAGDATRKYPHEIQPKALRQLRIMARVRDWNELREPPGNKLHALSGDRKGQYAIWINDQWRIAFRVVDGAFTDVEIIDYH